MKESEINKVKCASTSAPPHNGDVINESSRHYNQCVEASGKVQIVDFAGNPPIWMIVSGPYVSMMMTASCLHRCLRSDLS